MARGGRSGARGRGRRPVAALVIVGAVVALLVLAGPRLVPGDRLAARAAEALAAASGARVTVADASVTLLGGPGLRLRGVRLEAPPAWEATLESADVSLAVAPLLARRVVVDRVLVRGSQAAGAVSGRRAGLSSFALEVSGLNLAVTGPGGLATAAAAAPAGAGLQLPAGLAGAFELRAAGAALDSFSLADVTLAGRLQDGRLALESLAAACCGGAVAGTGSLALGTPPRAWEAALDLEGVDAAALLGPWAPEVAAQLDLRLTGAVRVSGAAGADAAATLAGLAVGARLGAGEGMVRAGPWLAGAEPYLGERQDLVDVRVSDARLAARLEGGRCLVDTLRLRGPDTDWDLSGVIGLPGAAPGGDTGGDIDLAVHVRLPAGFTPQLGAMTFFAEAMRDAEERVNLDLALRGPLAAPAVNLDLAAMSRRVRKP